MDQPLEAEFGFLARFVLNDRPRLGNPGVQQLARRHRSSGQPMEDLRKQYCAEGCHLLHLLEPRPPHSMGHLPGSPPDLSALAHQLGALVDQVLQDLSLVLVGLGKQGMMFDLADDLLGLLKARLDALHPALSQFLECAVDPLRHSTQDTRFVRIADLGLLHRRIRRQNARVAKAPFHRVLDY